MGRYSVFVLLAYPVLPRKRSNHHPLAMQLGHTINLKSTGFMKPTSRNKPAAFTLVEILVIVSILIFFASVVLPMLGTPRHRGSPRIKCMNNQKQIGTAFRVFASDNDDKYPLQATNNPYIYPPDGTGSAPGAVASPAAQAWQVYQAMWNELQTPKILLCPSDRTRATYNRSTDFNGLAKAPGVLAATSLGHPGNQDRAVSYAPQANADEVHPLGLLTLDRNINFATEKTRSTTAPAASGSRFIIASEAAASALYWVGGRTNLFHDLEGNLTFADGHVEQTTVAKLQSALTNAGHSYGWGTPAAPGAGASVFLMP